MATATAYLQQLLTAVAVHPGRAASIIGQAYVNLAALRARTAATLRRLEAGEPVGAETSVDKLLLSAAEQSVLDAAASLRSAEFFLDDDSEAAHWRDHWWYSRAASIYGGAREVQHSIIADRILKLPKENTGGR
jgi:alkylation response protein AidB-like acyl-CoA dehydrogenase